MHPVVKNCSLRNDGRMMARIYDVLSTGLDFHSVEISVWAHGFALNYFRSTTDGGRYDSAF
jgi:hypothetical protein